MKLATAIGDTYINEKLKKIDNIEIVGKDISYQEGVIEILEEKKDIDVLILSNNILGEYDFIELINKIIKVSNKVELIVFLKERNINIENYLYSKNIYKIYYLNKENYNLFLNYFNSNNLKIELEKEINNFKKMIEKNNKNYKKNNIFNYKKNKYKFENINLKKVNLKLKITSKNNKKKLKLKEKFDSKIIVITGNYGSGKSIVSSILSKVISCKNKSVLLIDFNYFSSSIKTIFNIKKSYKKIDEINYKNLIIKLEKNLNLFYRIDIFFDQNGEIENYKLSNFLKEIKNNFEYIILDLTSNIKYKFIKTILISSNKIIFLLEPNLIEIKKTNNILEIFLKDFNIEIDKIKIVFNKTNKYQLAESILEELFSNFEIIGNIKYSEQYNNLINTNNFKNIEKNEYEKIYKKI